MGVRSGRTVRIYSGGEGQAEESIAQQEEKSRPWREGAALFDFQFFTRKMRRIAVLPMGHFLGHIQQQLAIFLIRLAQQAAKLIEIARLFAGAAPGDVV